MKLPACQRETPKITTAFAAFLRERTGPACLDSDQGQRPRGMCPDGETEQDAGSLRGARLWQSALETLQEDARALRMQMQDPTWPGTPSSSFSASEAPTAPSIPLSSHPKLYLDLRPCKPCSPSLLTLSLHCVTVSRVPPPYTCIRTVSRTGGSS